MLGLYNDLLYRKYFKKQLTACIGTGGISIYDSLRADIHNHFDIEKVLKTSERGAVYLVRNRTTKTRSIYREFTGNSEVYQKMQELECSYLPKIEAVAEKDGHVLVLEEYIQGDTLAYILKNGPILESQAQKITIHLCHALESLHSLGVVHRDIKPENVILRGDEAVLIDFDASRISKPQRVMDTQAMGTAGYAAPEQYGFAQTDARADIYALGVLLNEMLVKQHPSRQLADGPFLPVIEKCIEVNVDKRYDSAGELCSALDTVAKRVPSSKKHKGTYKLIAVLVVVFVLICSVLYGIPGWRAGREQTAPSPSEQQGQSSPVSDTPQESTAPTESQSQSASAESQPQPEAFPAMLPEDLIGVWPGAPVGRTTAFEYDLDGDGTPESYRFGVAFDNTLVGMNVLEDNQAVESGGRTERAPMPCVWRLLPDGSEEVAAVFADLLIDPQITIWRTSETDAPAPQMQSLDAVWRGCVMVNYTYEHLGTWIYEATATIDGTELRAVTVTILWDWDEFWAAQ